MFIIETPTIILYFLSFIWLDSQKRKYSYKDKNLADDYVVETEWKNLYGNYEVMENFCTVLEKRIDVIFDAISLNECEDQDHSKIRY